MNRLDVSDDDLRLLVSDDDLRLLNCFDVLLPAAKGAVLQRISVAACFAVLTRGRQEGEARGSKSPEAMTEAFLMQCMPTVPTGYLDDCGFEEAYRDLARHVLEQRCIAVVLGSEKQDAGRAAGLVDELTECAIYIASDFCAPNFAEDGFLGEDTVLAFIERWRENFTSRLARAASRPAG